MICFDTTPLIWGIQGVADPEHSAMIQRTRRYIRHLKRTQTRIIVPAPVATEYLQGFPAEEQDEQRKALEASFMIPAFDLRAAAEAARIEANKELITSVRQQGTVRRQALKIDAQILAVALVNNATAIVTSDPHFRKLAAGRILVHEVPDIAEQPDLYGN